MGINPIVTERDHDSRSADPSARTTVTEWPLLPCPRCSPPARDCRPGRDTDEVGYLAAPAAKVDTM